MEPVAAFATIVSLLRIFKQERGEKAKADHQAFLEWLGNHRHEELKNLIVNTAALRTEVDKILAADHAAMLEKLDQIQTIVVTLLSRVDEFRGLSLAVAPDAELSDQAVSVLRQFAASSADLLYYANYGSGSFVISADGEPLEAPEPRFLKNDLDQLVMLGLLSLAEYNSEGNPLFALTRSGAGYLKAIDGKSSALVARDVANNG